MPIDPNIPLSAGQGITRLEGPAESSMKALAFMQAKAAFDAKKQERLDNEAFKGIAAESGGDLQTMIKRSREAGLMNHANALEKHWLDTQESFAKLDENGRKAETAKADRLARKAIWATTPERWNSDPELSATPFEQRNAVLFGSMTAQQILEQQGKQEKDASEQAWKRETFGETKRHNRAMETKPGVVVNNGGRETFKDTSSLRGEYNNESKVFKDTKNAYKRIISAGDAQTPASDISLIYAYMRMLDPGSTVREGEFATAQNAGSIPQKITAAYNKAISGERLAPEVRADFINQAAGIFKKAEEGQKQVVDRYTRIANAYQLDPTLIVTDESLDMPKPKLPYEGQTMPQAVFDGMSQAAKDAYTKNGGKVIP